MPRVPTYDAPVVQQQPEPDVRMDPAPAPTGMQSLGAGLQQASGAMAKAFETVRNREDTINRSREFNQFYNEMQQEYMRVQDEEDLTDPLVARSFNEKMESSANQYIQMHGGSPDSLSRFQNRIEDAKGKLQSEMSSRVMSAQKKFVQDEVGKEISRISAMVIENPDMVTEAFQKIPDIMDEFSMAMTPEEEMANLNAMNNAVVNSSIKSFISRGSYQEARDMLDEYPFFIEMLTPDEQRNIMNQINDGLKAETRAIDDLNSKRNAIEQFRGRPLTSSELDQLVGLSSGSSGYSGMQGSFGKNWEDYQSVVAMYGEESPQAKLFKQNLVAQDQIRLEGEVGNAIEAFEHAKQRYGQESPQFRVAKNHLLSLDPEYQNRQEKLEKYTPSVNNLRILEDRTRVVMNNVYSALSLIFGEEVNENTDLDELTKKDPRWRSVGFIAERLANLKQTSAGQLEGHINSIKANEVIKHLAQVRASSPTGGAFGNMTNQESERLERLSGDMDIGRPENIIGTMMELAKAYPESLARVTEAFHMDFGKIEEEKENQREEVKKNLKEKTESGTKKLTPDGVKNSPNPVPDNDYTGVDFLETSYEDLLSVDIDSETLTEDQKAVLIQRLGEMK